MKVNYNLLILLFLIVLLTTSIYFIKVVKNEKTQCINNPFIYALKKGQEASSSKLMCSCSFLNGKYLPFQFNEDGVIAQKQIDNTIYKNASEIANIFKDIK